VKIILSRKGVDSSAGGFASPVLPDGTLLPIAIPDKRSPLCYRDIKSPAGVGRMVKHLSNNRVNSWDRVHLDPDLNEASVARAEKFQAAFGQCGAAQSHLASHQIGRGDVFLFFGWYRQVEYIKRRWRYVKNAPDQHIIFGWMQVDKVLPVESLLTNKQFPSLQQHPHCFGAFSGDNTIYTAPKKLGFNKKVTGAGCFPSLHHTLVLTAPDRSRSVWRVPDWMHPQGRSSVLSYHNDLSRWSSGCDGTLLRSAARGQEFVLDTNDYPEALVWLNSLFETAFSAPAT
jgi:hypothetical protein